VLVSRFAWGWAIDRYSQRLFAAFVTSVHAADYALLLFDDNSRAIAMIALLLNGVRTTEERSLLQRQRARRYRRLAQKAA
jgi:predicted MFS family arabinose efflux permease